jgi:hypothetical protein
MAALFRRTLGRWATSSDPDAWVALMNEAHLNPSAYLHASAWAPLSGSSRRLLLHSEVTHPLAARSLWEHVEHQNGAVLPTLEYAASLPLQWRLVMASTRAELMTLALWCGASVVHRQIATAVDRESASRLRTRMGRELYADVLQKPGPLGRCKGLTPGALLSGRFLLDLGLSMLLAWNEDSRGMSRRRIEAAAGPRRRPVEHYVGAGALAMTDATQAEAALLAFVARHAHSDERKEATP